MHSGTNAFMSIATVTGSQFTITQMHSGTLGEKYPNWDSVVSVHDYTNALWYNKMTLTSQYEIGVSVHDYTNALWYRPFGWSINCYFLGLSSRLHKCTLVPDIVRQNPWLNEPSQFTITQMHSGTII